MKLINRVRLYFSCWALLACLCIILNCLNIDWTKTNKVLGAVIVAVLGILQGSVLEFPLQTVATFAMGGKRRENKRASCDHLSLILNYNLLATSKEDIEECIETMYIAYKGNLSSNVSAVLVSATNDKELKEYELELRDKYRKIIHDELYREGLAFSERRYNDIDDMHFKNVWKKYHDIDGYEFKVYHLESVCERYTCNFMVIHRVSRVLKKCGQYQDLMLLSEGISEAYTYCDSDHYGKLARTFGEKLFQETDDVMNIINRRFDYTLVLDGDTGVPRGGVFELLEIAAAHPDKGIIQPSIKFNCTRDDTLYMHLEAMRQSIYEPMTNAMTALFGQSGFFGKALINNKLYIEHVIGNKDNLIERVPVDVLSHDTFEAALLKPLYAGSTYLLEAPSHNYVTWGIRERRWNRGEIILATYFWKSAFGKPMRWLQKYFQKSKFNKTKVRTDSELDFVTSYVAHSALRHMLMKPMLLLYICINVSVHLKQANVSIIIVMFCILIFPKFAVCNRENYKSVILESIASVLQFTPEAVVGSIRLLRALHANISLNAKWVPQRAVEEEFRNTNPFISGFRHLWGYSLFSFVIGALVIAFVEEALLLLALLITVFLLPVFTGVTSLKLKSCLRKKKKSQKSSIETILKPRKGLKSNSLYSSQTYHSLGHLWNGYKYQDTTYLLPSRKGSIDMLIDNTYNFGKNRKKSIHSWTVQNKQWSENNRSWKSQQGFEHQPIKQVDHHSVIDGEALDISFKRNLNGKTHFHESSSNETRIDIENLFRNLNILHQFKNKR